MVCSELYQIRTCNSLLARLLIRQPANPPTQYQVVDVNPEIVEERPELLFRLKKQEFIELVKKNRTDEALEFAERELARRVEGDEGLLRELESAMALLLFEDAKKSPLAHFLSDEYTHETADLLNASILASETRAGDGRSRLPAMLHLLLWLEARANEVVKKDLAGSDIAGDAEPLANMGLSYVPRIPLAMDSISGGSGEERPAVDYARTVFASMAAREQPDRVEMEISDDDDDGDDADLE